MYWKRIKEVFIEECKKFVKLDLEDLEFIERSSQNEIKKLLKSNKKFWKLDWWSSKSLKKKTHKVGYKKFWTLDRYVLKEN